MLLMQQHQDGIVRRLLVIGIPNFTIRPFVDALVKWESCSGVEWTIKRLKGLKVDLLRTKEGLQTQTWVRKNSKGEFAGFIGTMFRWALKSDRNFSRCVQAFMAYTYYILPELTQAQKDKFLSGINPVNPDDGLTKDFHKSFYETVTRTVRRRAVSSPPRPLVTYQGSPDKKAPRIWGRKSVPQSEDILCELDFFKTKGGPYLYHKYERLYAPLLYGTQDLKWMTKRSQELYDSYNSWEICPSDTRVECGEIHFLQEPGGKLRSVASPFRLHQEALRPLGNLLYDVVKSLPWDCTFDQTKAHPYIQSHLHNGGNVHSIDLSSATDHFPLSLQLTALRALIVKSEWDHIDLFEEISRGYWSSPIGRLQWVKGQPLGLFPSFASFTLTHGLLLLHLADGDFHNQFFVVGDDVVILEDQLKDKYISMLDRMSCPWSADKSLSSNKLAEFAGKIITSNWVIPQLKWRRMSNDNFLDICRLLGRRSRDLLSSRQKRVFDQVAHLVGPFGLDFSLPGDNLEKMIWRTLDVYRPSDRILGALMGLRRRINHLVHTSGAKFDHEALVDLSLTFDEKVKSVLCQTVFSNWEVALSIGLDGLDTVPWAPGVVGPGLPFKELQVSRLSTLEWYERALN